MPSRKLASGGINVYPEDIEAVLNKISGIKDSCVIGMERENKREEIHAVLLLEREIGKAEVEKIINEANKKLDASQKIQNYTVWHDKDFPRTTTMKITKTMRHLGLKAEVCCRRSFLEMLGNHHTLKGVVFIGSRHKEICY